MTALSGKYTLANTESLKPGQIYGPPDSCSNFVVDCTILLSIRGNALLLCSLEVPNFILWGEPLLSYRCHCRILVESLSPPVFTGSHICTSWSLILKSKFSIYPRGISSNKSNGTDVQHAPRCSTVCQGCQSLLQSLL